MMKKKLLVAVLSSCCAFAALAGLSIAQSQTGNSNSGQTGNANRGGTSGSARANNSADMKFAMTAAQDGMTEVELGRLAVQKGTSDAVKQFGQRMIDDHTNANQQLMQLATSKGMTLPTALDAKHQAMVTKFQAMTGADFDRQYAKQMVKDHQKAVSLFQKEAGRGADADLKAFASQSLPILQGHLSMAQGLNSGMGGGRGGGANRNTSGGMSGNSNMSGNGNTGGNMNGMGGRNSNRGGNSNRSGNRNSNRGGGNMNGNANRGGNTNNSNR